MNLADWRIEDAIAERVRQEDLAMWAQRETPPFEIVPPMPHQVWAQTPLHAFLSKIIP